MATSPSLDTEQQFRRSLRRLDDALTFGCHQSPLGGASRHSLLAPADLTNYTALLPGSRTLQTDADFTVDLSLLDHNHTTIDDVSTRASDASCSVLPADATLVSDNIDELCRHFFDSRRVLAGAAQLLELLHSYQTLCQRRLERLGRQLRAHYQGSKEGDSEQRQRLWQQLSMERDTWRLMAALLADEMSDDWEEDEDEEKNRRSVPAVDPASAIQRLFLSDRSVRRAQLVIDWLESCARDQLQSGYHERVEFFSDAPTGWENTLHALRAPAGAGGGAGDSLLTPALDPDAPARLQRHLHGVDAEDERRLLRSVFALLRAGQLAEAQQLCVRVGQAWRAAALDGWKLYGDSGLSCRQQQVQSETAPSAGRLAPVGNLQRDLWRLAAWRLAEDPGADRHERAVYGALCGHVDAVLPACVGWEDRVWALFRQQVDARVAAELDVWRASGGAGGLHGSDGRPERCERELRELERRRRNPGEHGMAALFDEADSLDETAKSSSSVKQRPGSDLNVRRLFNQLQREAVLGDMEAMISTLASFCEHLSDISDHTTPTAIERRQLLRAAAHMSLLLRCQSSAPPVRVHEQCDSVLAGYVRELLQDPGGSGGVVEQAVWFIARLSDSELRTVLLSELMSAVDERSYGDTRERELARQLVREQSERAGLPLSAASVLLVGERRRRFVGALQQRLPTSPAPGTSLGSRTTPSVDAVAVTISWLLYDPALRVEAAQETNALCRALLLSHNVAAANQLATELPEDTVAVIHSHWHVEAGGQLPPVAARAVRELLCVRALLLALQSYDDWSEQFHRRPKPPQAPLQQKQPVTSSVALAGGSSFAESIAHEQSMRQYEMAELRWRSSHETLTRTATQRLYNVLLFPDGGWMADQDTDWPQEDEESPADCNDERQHQMTALRGIYLPQCVFVLQTVLRATGRECECLQLADVIASERHAIYRNFSSHDLRSFLRGLRDICLPLLDTKHDALGYRID